MDRLHLAAKGAETVNVAVVQGNIDQHMKWDRTFQQATVRKYLALSRQAAEDADLIVWPETAAPFYLFHQRQLTASIQAVVDRTGVTHLIGSPAFGLTENGVTYHNSAYLLEPGGGREQRYDKAHLVPFGEYVPFKRWLPFLGKMAAAAGDFTPGPAGKTLDWRGTPIGVQICYEIIFPQLSRTVVRRHAALLVNLTNDAWYGRSGAPYQHFAMTVLRAVENRRTLVRAANTGISGFVDPAGRILAQTPLFEAGFLKHEVPLLRGQTLYVRWGDWLPKCCIVFIILIYIVFHWRADFFKRVFLSWNS